MQAQSWFELQRTSTGWIQVFFKVISEDLTQEVLQSLTKEDHVVRFQLVLLWDMYVITYWLRNIFVHGFVLGLLVYKFYTILLLSAIDYIS